MARQSAVDHEPKQATWPLIGFVLITALELQTFFPGVKRKVNGGCATSYGPSLHSSIKHCVDKVFS